MTDKEILRDLAQRYLAICNKKVQQERRDAWRRLNSLEEVNPLIYVRAFAWQEMPGSQLQCQDPFFHPYENFFRESLFRDTFDDDFIFEPWVTVKAVHKAEPGCLWGLPWAWSERVDPRGSRVWDPPLKDPKDLAKLQKPHHRIDEEATARRVARVRDAIGDIIPVAVDRGPLQRKGRSDISHELTQLRGLDQMMWDMMDRPEWLHRLLAFMRDGILGVHAEAEAAGDYTLLTHLNQAMPYALELDDPSADGKPVTRDQLWFFCASQETTLVGPKMFDTFMLQYQIPIMAKFGLVAYGCCEDLTPKIDLLRQIPNLRRIAVALTADVATCAEQIGADYVLSYRPSPTDMVGYDFDPERILDILRRDLRACREHGCHVDITLKDVETVQGDPTRVQKWVQLARQTIREVWEGVPTI
jgi:hypothetical protein